ncbi:hypothetical protein QUF99_15320 [Bacillus sp. DX4.1]|uniref:hypothetical protein n=1 Tax=Bacillus sp. DX4.1 TaxID=3055867 RepID=UPI0025A26EC6|nr:hypothetical protein [Bacillus sp. DX4.1]MDM5188638.1 hypothetical protein [Bacillus sp. DX4.1]
MTLQIKTKLFISIISSILLIIGSTMLYMEDHSMKWLWIFIAASCIVQSFMLYKKRKEVN